MKIDCYLLKMHKVFALLFSFVFLVCGSVKATFANTIIAEYSTQEYPLSYLDDAGKPAGMMVELTEQLLAKSGYQVSWQSVDYADSLPADLAIFPLMPKEQQQSVSLPVELNVRMYRHKSINQQLINPYRIGIVDGSASASILPQEMQHNIVKYHNRDMMLTDVVNGHLKVFVDLPVQFHRQSEIPHSKR